MLKCHSKLTIDQRCDGSTLLKFLNTLSNVYIYVIQFKNLSTWCYSFATLAHSEVNLRHIYNLTGPDNKTWWYFEFVGPLSKLGPFAILQKGKALALR